LSFISLVPEIGTPGLMRGDGKRRQLDDKITYNFWTFNGKVPGPFVRVRVGDTVEVHLKNDEASLMYHSVDFHAATGPGGGAEFTQTEPGQEKVVTFKALIPGLFVYHCATPSVPHHITNGGGQRILCHARRALHRQALRNARASGDGL
jgi:hypothetical protein